MGNRSFDDLLQAFQFALVTAQESLRVRGEEAGQRRDEEDKAEGARSSFYTFAIPQNGADGEQYEMLPLPVSSFRAYPRPRIAMLSLEFECDLQEKKIPGAARRYSLVIAVRRQRRWWHRKRRRMQIVFHGTDRAPGEVRINGKLLAHIPRYDGADKGCSAPPAKGSILAKLTDLLRYTRRSQRFLMTVEQSQKVREIVGQADAETVMRGGNATWWGAIFSR